MTKGQRTVVGIFIVASARSPLALRADVFNMPLGQTSLTLVPVKNAGNPGELSGGPPSGAIVRICGEVDYNFNISKYETTEAQYVQMLNAVAAMDTYGLYNAGALPDKNHIVRDGSPGSFTYSVPADYANRPMVWQSWGDAIRFVNWLENGQPTGPEGLATTEDGSYFLNGALSVAQLMAVNRKPGAQFVLPNEDEWYKAAYHKNDGPTNHYWDYATGTDAQPGNRVLNPDPGNNANYYHNGLYTLGAPYWRTEVGEFENSESPYGTYDQNGNVIEWVETAYDSTNRAARGGGYAPAQGTLSADRRDSDDPSIDSLIGFRIAFVPEPATTGLLLAALALCSRRFHS